MRRSLVLGVLLAVVVCAPAGAFSKAVWGDATRDGISQFPLYHRLGVSIVENYLHWSDVAPTRPRRPSDPADPAYRWPAAIDALLAGARAWHMRVLLELTDAPAWADGRHPGHGWAPRRPADFAAFAAAAARRYPGVHLWLIWGEPTKLGSFRPLPPARPDDPLTPAQRAAAHLYARMLDAAYGALTRVSRHNRVIGGCTYTFGALDTLRWIENLRLPDGRPPRMDMYAHNPFSYDPPAFGGLPSPFGEVQFADLPRLARWLDRYLRPGLPLFLAEWTLPTAIDDDFNYWVAPAVAARWIATALREARGWHRIYALGWIDLYDDPPISAGGLLRANGRPKPGFAAFAAG